jgi:hypothetical protein
MTVADREHLEPLRTNLQRVREVVDAACQRAGRPPDRVRLVAVTKYVDLSVVRALLAMGVGEIGENRVQQLVARAAALGTRFDDFAPDFRWGTPAASAVTSPRWHMIGHLQRNKVRAVLPHVRIIHSIDSLRLAAELDKVAAALDAPVEGLIEVNVSGEQSKFGVTPADLPALLESLRPLSHLRLRGLMTMAPFDPDPEHARPHFARLRDLSQRLRGSGTLEPDCTELSMGMSQDYGVAVEEGATLVRVGSALFEGLPGEPAG